MTNVKGNTIRLRRIGDRLRSTVCLKICDFNQVRWNRKESEMINHLVDGQTGGRTVRIRDTEYFYIIMATACVVHATVRTFFCGVMAQGNIRQIAHTIMGTQYHARCHDEVEHCDQYGGELFQIGKIIKFSESRVAQTPILTIQESGVLDDMGHLRVEYDKSTANITHPHRVSSRPGIVPLHYKLERKRTCACCK